MWIYCELIIEMRPRSQSDRSKTLPSLGFQRRKQQEKKESAPWNWVWGRGTALSRVETSLRPNYACADNLLFEDVEVILFIYVSSNFPNYACYRYISNRCTEYNIFLELNKKDGRCVEHKDRHSFYITYILHIATSVRQHATQHVLTIQHQVGIIRYV